MDTSDFRVGDIVVAVVAIRVSHYRIISIGTSGVVREVYSDRVCVIFEGYGQVYVWPNEIKKAES